MIFFENAIVAELSKVRLKEKVQNVSACKSLEMT